MIPPFRRRPTAPPDFQEGQFVKVVGFKKTGFIEKIEGDLATICWGPDSRERWQLSFLRDPLIKRKTHKFDGR